MRIPSLPSSPRSLAFLLAASLAPACGTSPASPATAASSSTGSGGGGGGPVVPACHRSTLWTPPPACGSNAYTWQSMIASPKAPDFDAALAKKADRHDRQFHALNGHGAGLNVDVVVPLANTTARAKIDAFLKDGTGWDFEAYAGMKVTDAITSWQQIAGAYTGPGAAADAFRYGTLRDQGAPCADVDQARQHLLAAMDGLHIATAITGIPGGMARGLARVDLPGDGAQMVVPLFDKGGKPLPPLKNNGTWRADNSGGKFPNYIWNDSCSRDMMVGWAVGYAGVWEVIRLDPSFSDDLKKRMKADAVQVVQGLMKVGDAGYDLEIRDPDGRVSMFGYLNENAIDTGYLAGAQNGFQGIMALGIVGAFAYVADDPALDQYLDGSLVAERHLDTMARDNLLGVDIGLQENFSNDHMTFQAGWLAERYLCWDQPREVIRSAVAKTYARPGVARLPVEQKQTFYDFVYAASDAGATSETNLGKLDDGAVSRGLDTLKEFPDAPFWEVPSTNCDDKEIASGNCLATDGTKLTLLGFVGRGNKLVSSEPVPMRVRPASNYFWRTSPYEVNGGGDGTRLLPAADFRMTYWMGRWLRR